MSRETKRKLSIVASVIGVILLVVTVISSDEYKEKVEENKAMADVIEINLTEIQKKATDYNDYNIGLEIVEATYNWRSVINKKFGENYYVYGDKKTEKGTIIYGSTGFSYWILLMDKNDEIVWMNETNKKDFNFYEVVISYVYVNDEIVTMFAYDASHSDSIKRAVIIEQYTIDGEKISMKVIEDIEGEIKYLTQAEDKYYLCLDERYSANDSIYEISVDGECKKLCSLANEEKMERYFVEDMVAKDGKLYVSALCIKVERINKAQTELDDDVLDLDDNIAMKGIDGENYLYFTKEELEQIRDVYTAVLFECNPETGDWIEIDRKENRVPSEVTISNGGELVWKVGDIFTSVNYGLYILGNTRLMNYYYDVTNSVVREEKLDEIGIFARYRYN